MTRLYTARDTSILYSRKNTAAAGEVVGNDIVRRRISMLSRGSYSGTAGMVVLMVDSGASFARKRTGVGV